jgi:hypothetical protein
MGSADELLGRAEQLKGEVTRSLVAVQDSAASAGGTAKSGAGKSMPA